MTRSTRCSACTHPYADEIDRLLTERQPVLAVARKFGLGRSSVRLHRENHMDGAAGGNTVEAGDPLDELIRRLERETKARPGNAALARELRAALNDRERRITVTTTGDVDPRAYEKWAYAVIAAFEAAAPPMSATDEERAAYRALRERFASAFARSSPKVADHYENHPTVPVREFYA